MRLHILSPEEINDNYVESNISAINFSKNFIKRINEISQPIFPFGVCIFTYCRIFTNGSFLYLSSDEEWVEHYFSSNYQDDVAHCNHYLPSQDIKYGFWNEFNMDKVFQSAHDDFNYWHGISFYEKNCGYMDYFDFGANKDNDKMGIFYLNNLPILSQFIQYFKEQVSSLVNNVDATKLINSKSSAVFRKNYAEQKQKVIKFQLPERSQVVGFQLPEKSQVVKFQLPEKNQEPPPFNGIILTGNEKECLHHLYQGKSVKEIGKFLNIPAKSAEFYIKSVKFKAQNLTRSELHNVLKNDNKFSLIFSYKPTENQEISVDQTTKKVLHPYYRLVNFIIFLGSIILLGTINLCETILNIFHSVLVYCY